MRLKTEMIQIVYFFDDAFVWATIIMSSILSITFVVVLLCNACLAIQWTIVPEIKIFEAIQGCLGQ